MKGNGQGIRVAGTGVSGSGANQLSSPSKVFVDADGNLYVVDSDNLRVQKWAPNASQGVTVAIIPDEMAYDRPISLCVDNWGNIYVGGYASLLKFEPDHPNDPIVFFYDSNLIPGRMWDIKIFNNNFYLRTEIGVVKVAPSGATGELLIPKSSYPKASPNDYFGGMDIDYQGNIYLSRHTFQDDGTSKNAVIKFQNGSTTGGVVLLEWTNQTNGPCGFHLDDVLISNDGSIFVSNDLNVKKWIPESQSFKKIWKSPVTSWFRGAGLFRYQDDLYISDGRTAVYKVNVGSCLIPEFPNISTVSTSLCSQSSINITTSNNCENYTVKWYKNDNYVSSGEFFTATSVGEYYATYTNSCGTSQNSNKIIITDLEDSKPVISASGSTLVCSGTPVVLNASGSGIQWYKNNVYFDSGSSLSTTQAGSYTAKSVNSCGSSAFSNSIEVTVDSYPSKPVISASSTTVCSGVPVVLNASGSGILWYRNNDYFRSGSSLSTSMAGSYTAKSITNCGSSTFSDPVVVTIGSYPSAPVVSVSGSTTVCSGIPVLLNASGSGVQWYKDNTYFSSGSSLSTTQAGSYTAKSVNNCGSSTFSEAIVVTTDFYPNKPVISASGSTTACSGIPVVLNASGSGIQWFKDNSYFSSGSSLSTTQAGSYIAKSVNNCGSSDASEPIEVKSIDNASAPVISANGPTTVCFGTPVVLTSTKTDIKWYRNGSYFGAGNSLTTTKPGIYTAKSVNICGSTPASNPIVVNANLAYKVKTSRFDDVEETVPTATATEAEEENKTLAAEEIQSSCEAHVDAWIEKLEGMTEEQRSALKPKLLAICVAGGDLDHPMGASTLDGDKNVEGMKSFADAIKSVEPAAFTMLRNPWLVDMPYPYVPKLQATDIFISKSDEKICAKIDEIKAALGNPSSEEAFFNALVSKYGEAMVVDRQEFDDLLNSCNSCKYLLKEDIQLPIFFGPGAKGCISKNDFDQAKTDLGNQIPDFFLNTSHANYESVFATFMNHRWGFSLTFTDYKEYETKLSNTPGEILCNKPVFAALEENFYADFESDIEIAVGKGRQEYDTYIPAIRNQAMLAYTQNCSAAKASMDIKSNENIYHYTLYYYDQAENLVRTVPPAGVKLLGDDEVYRVQRSREFKASECSYTGPGFASPIEDIHNNLAATIENSKTKAGAALEFWTYQADAAGGQVLLSANKQYMVQLCFGEGFVNADIFTLQDDGINKVSIVRSNHISGVTSNMLVWNHIVLQAPAGEDLLSGPLELWINGKKITPAPSIAKAACGWEIGSSVLNMPQNTSLLKHVRLYNRYLDMNEIRKNAFNACMSAYDQTNMLAWNRFNMPVAGGPSTLGENSTIEVQYQPVYPPHTLVTNYAYNTNNQVIRQSSPDGGESNFWYDELGRLIVSQNAQQKKDGNFSYTKYDELGRIIEVGQKAHDGTGINGLSKLSNGAYQTFLSQGSDSQLTQTYYDEAAPAIDGLQSFNQQNLRKRVAATVFRPAQGSASVNASYYSYDLAGNVKTLWQQLDGLNETKSIDYEYDLVSGKVNFVAYQHGKNDAFYYQYKYDAENRLIAAYSSIDAIVKVSGVGSTLTVPYRKMDASYQYYLHGPLARVELGDEGSKVQGMDYAYTLQGWLKGVNGNLLNSDTEINKDGAVGSYIPRDALAYSLGYYQGDYQSIGGSTAAAFNMQWQPSGQTGQNLYNGNISHTTLGIKNMEPVGYTYRYDQLNRLTKMRQHSMGTTAWGAMKDAYQENIEYDANGNIQKYGRYGQTSSMDKLRYKYYEGSNKLAQVSDDEISSGTDDLKPGQAADNYWYDAIGNLIKDKQEHISGIDWTVYGKIKQINKDDGNPSISYSYDASGNRISKTNNNATTWYIRDAQGNSLAVYDNKDAGVVKWQEQQLYGSSRLGMWKPGISSGTSGSTVWGISGKKFYELNNHLGNVLAVISDNRVQHQNGGTLDYYEPDVVSAQDYYPFGMLQPGRSVSSGSYRYGFNGKENDNEVKGDGNQQDYGMRIYDPRLGRFLSVDPLTESYPELTPYQFASNAPVNSVDLDGLERQIAIDGSIHDGPRNIQKINREIWDSRMNQIKAAMKKDAIPPPTSRGSVDYASIASRTGIEENAIRAVAKVESKGAAFYSNGEPVKRFEGHWFKKFLNKSGIDASEYPDLAYTYGESFSKEHGVGAYNSAVAVDKHSAMLSTSYGAFQIMGFNYKDAGFNTVEEFVAAQSTFDGQVESFVNFVSSNKSMLKALKNRDFTKFAKLYNGEKYKDNKYDEKMQEQYEELVGKED